MASLFEVVSKSILRILALGKSSAAMASIFWVPVPKGAIYGEPQTGHFLGWGME